MQLHTAMPHRFGAFRQIAMLRRPSQSAAYTKRTGSLTTSAAKTDTRKAPRKENVGLDRGDAVFVDSTCIDCDTCRWMDPATYDRVGSMTAVVAQPDTPEARRLALQALLACPTHSIQVRSQHTGELSAAARDFPLPTQCQDVYHCGYHSEASFGATSWFVRRPGGNVLMDSPRWNPALAKGLQELGGVRYIVLSHRDDVADHAKFAEHFGAERIIHRSETNRRQGTDKCEVQLSGSGPWRLPDGGDDVEILFTPGHTSGSCSMLFKPAKALFSGDHLMFSSRLGRLSAATGYNWDSVDKQLENIRMLLQYDWLHLLPGHGRQRHFDSEQDRLQQVHQLLVDEGAAGVL